MDGPHVAVHLDGKGDVVYGCDNGRDLVEITDAFTFKSDLWFLVQWEGYTMLEAVPLSVLIKHFPNRLVAYFETHVMFGGVEESDSD